MHLPIRVSSTDGVPIYQQIVQQVKYLVASFRLFDINNAPYVTFLPSRFYSGKQIRKSSTYISKYVRIDTLTSV